MNGNVRIEAVNFYNTCNACKNCSIRCPSTPPCRIREVTSPIVLHHLYTFLSVEHSELDRNLISSLPNAIGCAARDQPRAGWGLNGHEPIFYIFESNRLPIICDSLMRRKKFPIISEKLSDSIGNSFRLISESHMIGSRFDSNM